MATAKQCVAETKLSYLLPLALGIALAVLQQVTGINVFLYFGAAGMGVSLVATGAMAATVTVNGTVGTLEMPRGSVKRPLIVKVPGWL